MLEQKDWTKFELKGQDLPPFSIEQMGKDDYICSDGNRVILPDFAWIPRLAKILTDNGITIASILEEKGRVYQFYAPTYRVTFSQPVPYPVNSTFIIRGGTKYPIVYVWKKYYEEFLHTGQANLKISKVFLTASQMLLLEGYMK